MAVSKWFDYNSYMSNKLAQVQKTDATMDMTKLLKAFADAGFVGAEGAEAHFKAYGQYEELAPNAYFNAVEYYRAKAADYYEKDPKKVTDLDVANIKLALANSKMSAWEHYKMFGNSEGVNPSNGFDTEAYMAAKLTALNTVKDGKQYTMAELLDSFKAAGLSALEHFMMYGGAGDGEVVQKYEGKIPAAFAVPEAKKVVSDANIGKTYPLTTGFDDLTGTANDDTFMANSVDADATLNPGDKIDGGEGTDTLKIYASGGATNFVNADIKNVEIVRMVRTAATAADEIKVSGNADVEELWFENATMATSTELRMDQKLGFLGTVAGGTFSFKDASTATNDSATLAFDNATVTGLTVTAIENLTFEFSGKNGAVTVTAASAATLDVTGNGNAAVTLANGTSFKSVDTTGFAGDLTLTLATVAADFAYKGGAGNEKVTLGNLANAKYSIDLGAGDDTLTLGTTTLTAGAKIDGGTGYDTLAIGTAYDAAAFKHFSNFEALTFSASVAQDVSFFSGKDIIVGTDNTSFTLGNLRADQKIIVTTDGTGATVALNYKTGTGATPDRTVSLLLDDMDAANADGVTITALSETAGTLGSSDAGSSIKTLNITSEGAVHGMATDLTHTTGANIISSVTGATGLKTINIDGSSDLFFTAGATDQFTVNAEKFTGNLIFGGTAATLALTVTGGSGNDYINGGISSDKLVGGDGNDTLVAGAGTVGLDVLEGGKGIDKFDVTGVSFGAVGTAEKAMSTMVTINDFEKGESLTFTTVSDTLALSKYTGKVDDVNAAVYSIMTEGTAAVKWFTSSDGDTYIVVNSDTATTQFATTDQVVKLVGEHDLSTATFDATTETLTW